MSSFGHSVPSLVSTSSHSACAPSSPEPDSVVDAFRKSATASPASFPGTERSARTSSFFFPEAVLYSVRNLQASICKGIGMRIKKNHANLILESKKITQTSMTEVKHNPITEITKVKKVKIKSHKKTKPNHTCLFNVSMNSKSL